MSFTPRQVKSLTKEMCITSVSYQNKFQRTFTNEEMSSVSKKLDFDAYEPSISKQANAFKITKTHHKSISQIR